MALGHLPSSHRIRLGRLFDIPIEITSSWLFLSILAIWSFWIRYATIFRHSHVIAALMALVATIFLLGSVLLHELGHGLAGRFLKLRVSVVVLYFFGGATTASEPTNALQELWFTLVGPVVNLALALVFWAITLLANNIGISVVAQVSGEAAWLNLLLGASNLIPGAPLDGGRVLEAIAWRITKYRPKAIRIAARTGAGLAGSLMALGVLELLVARGGAIEGLWLGLIGYALWEGAKAEMARAWVQEVLLDKPATILLTDQVSPVNEDVSVRWLIQAEFLRHHVDAVPVQREGQTIGIVLASDVAGDSPGDPRQDTAGEVMRLVDELPKENLDASALEVLGLLGDHDLVLLMDENNQMVGSVSKRQVGLVLERLRSLSAIPAVKSFRNLKNSS